MHSFVPGYSAVAGLWVWGCMIGTHTQASHKTTQTGTPVDGAGNTMYRPHSVRGISGMHMRISLCDSMTGVCKGFRVETFNGLLCFHLVFVCFV